MTNTNTWKTHAFHVTDAYFGNRQNAGADFRIGDIGPVFYWTRSGHQRTTIAPIITEVYAGS